jgi:hypothetical protein
LSRQRISTAVTDQVLIPMPTLVTGGES